MDKLCKFFLSLTNSSLILLLLLHFSTACLCGYIAKHCRFDCRLHIGTGDTGYPRRSRCGSRGCSIRAHHSQLNSTLARFATNLSGIANDSRGREIRRIAFSYMTCFGKSPSTNFRASTNHSVSKIRKSYWAFFLTVNKSSKKGLL